MGAAGLSQVKVFACVTDIASDNATCEELSERNTLKGSLDGRVSSKAPVGSLKNP